MLDHAAIPDTQFQPGRSHARAVVVVLVPVTDEPLVERADSLVDGPRDIDAHERQRLRLNADLPRTRRVLARVADHAAHRRRTNAKPRATFNLPAQIGEALWRRQQRIVIQQDDVGAGCLDAEVGVARVHKRPGAGDPAHGRELWLRLGARPIIDYDDLLGRQARLVLQQRPHARHQVRRAGRQDDH